jgi:hypothetical protein
VNHYYLGRISSSGISLFKFLGSELEYYKENVWTFNEKIIGPFDCDCEKSYNEAFLFMKNFRTNIGG